MHNVAVKEKQGIVRRKEQDQCVKSEETSETNLDRVAGYQPSPDDRLHSISRGHHVRSDLGLTVEAVTAQSVTSPDGLGVRRGDGEGGLRMRVRTGWSLGHRRKAKHGPSRVALQTGPSAGSVVVFGSRRSGVRSGHGRGLRERTRDHPGIVDGISRVTVAGGHIVVVAVSLELHLELLHRGHLIELVKGRGGVRLVEGSLPMEVGVEREQVGNLGGTCGDTRVELTPMLMPGVEALRLRGIVVQVEVDGEQPVLLQSVDLGDAHAADLGPGTVDEGVVVEKLAADRKSVV